MRIQEYIDQIIKEKELETELVVLYMKINSFIMETLYNLKDHHSIPKMELTVTKDTLIHQIIIRKIIYIFREAGWSMEVVYLFNGKHTHIFNIHRMIGGD